MASMILIAAVGIFVVGVVVGIIFMVCGGIRREQRRYEEARHFRQEHGIWDDPDAERHFLPDEAPDGVSMIARGVNGLYVRRLPTVHGYDTKLAA